MTLYDFLFVVLGWLPVYIQYCIIGLFVLLILVIIIRLIVWLIEIIPGF